MAYYVRNDKVKKGARAGKPALSSDALSSEKKKNGEAVSERRTIAFRLKAFAASEAEKTASMRTKEKLRYLLDYYWLWILGILGAVVIIIYVIFHMFFTVKDYWFYAIFANTMEAGGNDTAIWKDFVEYAGYDTKEKKVEFNAASFFDPTVPSGTANSYFQAFVAVLESGDLDIVTIGKDALAAIGSSGRLLDLEADPVKDAFGEYADRFIYCEPYDETYSEEPVPVGIDLSGSRLVTQYHLYEQDAALGISAYTKRVDEAERFLRFLFEDGKREDNMEWADG